MQTLAREALTIGGVELRSRLFLGTGKYRSDEEMLAALEASGAELVTVALRRLDLDDPSKKTILDVIDWRRYRILPNTAGCQTADEAIRIARLARSMGLSDWVKLEVIPDPRRCRGPRSAPHGGGDPPRGRGRPQGLPRRPHAAPRRGRRELAPRGDIPARLELGPIVMAVVLTVEAGLKARSRGATPVQLRRPGASGGAPPAP